MSEQQYLAQFETLADAVEFETAVLTCGREFLSPALLAVADGAKPTEAYWQELAEQAEQAGFDSSDEISERLDAHLDVAEAKPCHR